MGITTRQRWHYRMLAEEEAARLTIIRALVRLAASGEDQEAATLALDRLEVSTSEVSYASGDAWSSQWGGLRATKGPVTPRGEADRALTSVALESPSPRSGLISCLTPGQTPPSRF